MEVSVGSDKASLDGQLYMPRRIKSEFRPLCWQADSWECGWDKFKMIVITIMITDKIWDKDGSFYIVAMACEGGSSLGEQCPD